MRTATADGPVLVATDDVLDGWSRPARRPGSGVRHPAPIDPPAGPVLLGRDAELAAVRSVLDPTGGARGSVLVLRGEPGVGRSALVDALVELAPPATLVLRTEGIASEAEIAYAGLHRLLCGVLSRTASVPAPQRAALHTAFGLHDGPRPDRFLMGLAALTFVTEAAAERPVLCIVDDAYRLDRESLGALTFAARRLTGDRVAVVFVERDDAPLDELADLPHLPVPGLGHEAARELLGQLYPEPIDPMVAARVVADLAGNPLALRELAATCADVDRLTRHALQPGPLPTGGRIRRRYGDRLAALTTGARDLLLVVAADRALDLPTVTAAAAALGVGAGAIDEAETAGLVEIDGEAVVVRHPLVRSACYWSATPHARRRVHAALAGLVDPDRHPERHAWHLALATVEPDEQVASVLARAARRAGERGATHEQVELLLRAAELSPDAEVSLRRHVRATAAAGTVGDHGRLARLVAWARATTSDPRLLAEVARIEALAPTFRWRYGRAARGLAQAATALDRFDRGRARDVALEALEVLTIADPYADGLARHELARTIRAMPRNPGPGGPTVPDLLLDGYADVVLDGWAAGAPSLKEAIRRWPADASRDATLGGADGHLGLVVRAAFSLWEHDRLRLPAPAGVPRGGNAARFALAHRARLEVARGQLDDAESTAAAIAELSAGLDGHVGWQLVGSVEAMAWRGRHDDTHRAVHALQLLAHEQRFGYAEDLSHLALAILANGSQRYADAAGAARRAARNPISELGSQALVELAEALVRLDDPGELEAVLGEIDRRARASGSALALGLSARAHALAASGADAADLFDRSIALLSTTTAGPELARAHLAYGEWLRRERRPTDARHHLREAHERLAHLGAASFAARARAELQAAGEHVPRQPRASSDLTAQERQVARLASEGQTNKEIATQLHLSASTIDFHLRKVYRKLGIASRRQLTRADLT